MSPSDIRDLEVFAVPPRWLFVRITTEDGVVGWGEPTLEGHVRATRAAVLDIRDYLIGQDAGRIEDHWQALYRGGFYRGGPVLMSAISGVEQALWDVKGKRLGAPVYELLGGAVRTRMRVYAWIGGDRPEDVANAARARVSDGYTAVKMNATADMEWITTHDKVSEAADRLGAVRQSVGDGIGVAVDFHGRLHTSMARSLVKELEPYHPLFIEEPVLPENNEALVELARLTTIPIATGERMYTRWGFKSLLANGGVGIIQPDLSHAGGIWESRKIAAMAEAYDVAVAPHCPLGPVALAACLQLDFCTPNAFIQEQSLGIHYNTSADLPDYLLDPNVFRFDAGYVSLPPGPGLGIAVDEEAVRAAAANGHHWRNPIWRNADGSITEW